MKGKGILMAALAMAAMGGMMSTNTCRDYDPEDTEPVKKPIPAGCKEYTFYGVTVVAINENSARKKCKRKAGIK